MKRFGLTICIVLLCCISAYTQVAICEGDLEPDESAILDIISEDKGLLIPRMIIDDESSSTAPVNNPAPGLLIYNLGSASVDAGFYAWNGDKWVEMVNSESNVINNMLPQPEVGELYEDNVGTSPTLVYMPSQNTYYGWVSADPGLILGSVTLNTTNSTADQIIVNEAGVYEVSMTISMQEATSNGHGENIFITVFRKPSGGSASATQLKYRSNESYDRSANGTTQGILQLNAGDALDLRFRSDESNTSLNLYHVSLIVKKLN